MQINFYKRTLFMFVLSMSFTVCQGQTSNESIFLAIEKKDTSAIRHLIGKGYSINQPRQMGWVKISPLIYAIQRRQISITKILIDSGANLDWQDGFETSALMYAAADNQMDIVKLLLGKGANAKLKDKDGNDALSAAKESKNKEIINLILQTLNR